MLRKSRTIILAVLTLTLVGSGLAMAAPKEKAADVFTLQGKVVAVNLKARTMSIKESRTGQEYLVTVPEEAGFKITFGKDSKRNMPQLENVVVGDRISCKVRGSGSGENLLTRRSLKVIMTKS